MQPVRSCSNAAGAAAFFCCFLAVAGVPAAAETAPSPDRFEATTTNMTPSDVALEIHVLEWSDAMNRADVVAALASASDVREKLVEMPTRGYVWVDGSSVGYAIRYAHRAMSDDGGERITFVVDRPLGWYSFEPWRIGGEAIAEEMEYSVIELDLTGGSGFVSRADDVVLDEENALVALRRDGAAEPVLSGARAAETFRAQGGGGGP